MKRGKVSIEFAIMKNGTVQGMTLSSPSGDVSLDRAAWGGITNSAPFSSLPSDFRGVEYQPFDGAGAWKSRLARELHAAGLGFDPLNLL